MSTERQVAIRDLVEEAKKRIVFLVICIVGLSYLMSLTSSSVLVNLPAAASLIIILRYLSLDFDMRKKAAAYNSKPPSANTLSQKKPVEGPKVVDRSEWRRKVNSPVVEDAIDQFTRHLISEWVTDLWYSRITPDKEAPEELVLIMNGVLGEMSCRMRNINLIDLLTRDLINILCTHLELFRATQVKIEKKQLGSLTLDQRDKEMKVILAAENKLHPALFSAAAEHKVLQHLMDGLISFTFKHEDLQCSFFRYTVRELLACAVMRPVLNLVSPRFINERIESVVISKTKAAKAVTTAQEASRSNGPSKISSDHFSRFLDPSVTGVELVQLNNGQSRTAAEKNAANNVTGMHQSKDPLLSIDTRSTRSWSSLPSDSLPSDAQGIQQQRLGGEWGEMLDLISHRKTEALAPENFENMWTKGRNYKKKEGVNRLTEQDSRSSVRTSDTVNRSNVVSKQKDKVGVTKVNFPQNRTISSGGNDRPRAEKHFLHGDQNISTPSSVATYQDDDEDDDKFTHLEEVESDSSSYTTEDEETNSITGLDSPGTKVWDGRTSRNHALSHIRHPLESSEGHSASKSGKANIRFQRLSRGQIGRKRSRLRGQKEPVWQEVERTSFLSGDGQDILNSKGHEKVDESSDDSEVEMSGRVHSGATASSSAPSSSVLESHRLAINTVQNSLLADSFMKLRCEVLGANIVKSGSRTFAVYSISVTDVNNNSWSIKRRFRHFEELHRRLKEFPEYNLHLPPKHFLSPGLDVPVIRERCKLLDRYLKKLLQLPTVSGSIEVWDFLSVDSQTYIFSNSISIIETLSVDLNDKPSETSSVMDHCGTLTNPLSSKREHLGAESKVAMQIKQNFVADGSKLNVESIAHSPVKKPGKEFKKPVEDLGSDSDTRAQKNSSSFRNLGKTTKERQSVGSQGKSELPLDAVADPTLPIEWVPPNLTVPILDLVDVIFQLQDGGWIRRKAFWVAKQVLQLGMGDAFDDWLIEKIQLLRKGSIVASGIRRVEQSFAGVVICDIRKFIASSGSVKGAKVAYVVPWGPTRFVLILWPDGIFLTKHPKRQKPPVPMSPSQSFSNGHQLAQLSSPRKEDIQNMQGKEHILSLDDQQQQEATRRAKFVYELMIDNPPAAIVSLVGRKEYEQCAKDLYFFLQSSVCLKQLAFNLLELLLLSAFPELDYAFKQLHEEKQKFGELK